MDQSLNISGLCLKFAEKENALQILFPNFYVLATYALATQLNNIAYKKAFSTQE